jgi:hypothetical protein
MMLHQYMQMSQFPQNSTPYSNYPPTAYSGYPQYQNTEQYSYAQPQMPQQTYPNYGTNPYQAMYNLSFIVYVFYRPQSTSSNVGHSDRTLWIGNLHQDVQELELRNHFQKFGIIENVKVSFFLFVNYC